MARCPRRVCFYPKSGHPLSNTPRPLSAICGREQTQQYYRVSASIVRAKALSVTLALSASALDLAGMVSVLTGRAQTRTKPPLWEEKWESGCLYFIYLKYHGYLTPRADTPSTKLRIFCALSLAAKILSYTASNGSEVAS